MRFLLLALVAAAGLGVSAGTSSPTRAHAVVPAPEPADRACSEKWWPQPRQNSCGNGSAKNPLAPSPSTVGRLTVAWTYESGQRGVPQPVVWKTAKQSAAYAYLASGGKMLALELSTGRARWSAEAEAAFGNGQQPAADRDVVVQTSGDVLRGYLPSSGHIVWQRRLGTRIGPLNPLLVADGNVFLTDDAAPPIQLQAYDGRTGRRAWMRWFGCFHCGLAAVGARVFIAGTPNSDRSNAGALYALNAKTGRTLWSAHLPRAEFGSPAVAGGRVFVRTLVGHTGAWTIAIEAFSATNGHHLWHAKVASFGAFWFNPVAADAELVAYAAEDGNLYAFDAATGALRWRAAENDNGVKPVIVNGLVWSADTGGRLVAHDARNGRRLWASTQLWPAPLSNADLPSVVVAGRFVLIGTPDGRLVAYRVP